MKDTSYREARLAYLWRLGFTVSNSTPITLQQLMACRSDEARRLLLKTSEHDKRKGTMSKKNRNTARLPKGPKAKPVKTEKPDARIEEMMRIAGKRES